MPSRTIETTSTARYRVVAFASALAMVTYLDRAAIGTLAPAIQRDLRLTTVEMGWVFTAFQLASGLFEIPTGRWADRVGTRAVLARIVIWWSLMTMATAAAVSYATMLAIRFLFGAGEAGAWPCVAHVLTLDSAARARPRAGHLLLRRAPGGRIDPRLHRRRRPAGTVAGAAARDVVARCVRDIWSCRRRLGRYVDLL